MAFDFSIKADQKFVLSLGWDQMTFSDVINHRTRLSADSRFCLDYRQLIDVTRVTTFELSSDQIMTLAHQRVFAPESRRALVVASSLHYGLGRMFQAYTEAQNISVFQRLDEAVEWVGVPMEISSQAILELCSSHDLA